jgi:O-antigen ligase
MKQLIIRTTNTITAPRLIIFGALIALFISSGIIDPSHLFNGTGYEFPKVEVLRVLSICIILCGIYLEFQRSFFTKWDKIFITVSTLSIILSVLVSINQQVSIFGNVFRNQGALLYLPILISLVVLYRVFEARHVKYLFITILAASLINAARALLQFKDLLSDPEKFSKGIYVNGFFGQSNFFSALMVFGLIAAAYFFGKKLSARYKLSFASLITLFSVATFLSLSRWGILTLIATAVLIVLYELGLKRLLKYLFILFYILLIPGMALSSAIYPEYEMHFDIWTKSFYAYRDAPILNKIFGYGFDNLNNVFLSRNAFPGLNVDRAHNLILDLATQFGLAGIGLLLAPVVLAIKTINKILDNRKLFFLFLAFTTFILKTTVNEYSISNLYMFFVVSVGLMKLVLTQKRTDDSNIEA